jgi:hypothetical protein
VAAEKKVILPGDDAGPGDRAPLERNHSHFVLVPGSFWGDESPWLSRVATEIAGSAPSATVLINGGEIAFQDVAHSLEAHRPVLVIAGTGRTADRIAAAAHDHHTDEQAAELAGSPLVTVVSWAENPAAVCVALEELTGPEVLRSRRGGRLPGGRSARRGTQGHSGRSGLTDAVDVPASIVVAAHSTRLDPVCLS